MAGVFISNIDHATIKKYRKHTHQHLDRFKKKHVTASSFLNGMKRDVDAHNPYFVHNGRGFSNLIHDHHGNITEKRISEKHFSDTLTHLFSKRTKKNSKYGGSYEIGRGFPRTDPGLTLRILNHYDESTDKVPRRTHLSKLLRGLDYAPVINFESGKSFHPSDSSHMHGSGFGTQSHVNESRDMLKGSRETIQNLTKYGHFSNANGHLDPSQVTKHYYDTQ